MLRGKGETRTRVELLTRICIFFVRHDGYLKCSTVLRLLVAYTRSIQSIKMCSNGPTIYILFARVPPY
jgi:hypothetical protein